MSQEDSSQETKRAAGEIGGLIHQIATDLVLLSPGDRAGAGRLANLLAKVAGLLDKVNPNQAIVCRKAEQFLHKIEFGTEKQGQGDLETVSRSLTALQEEINGVSAPVANGMNDAQLVREFVDEAQEHLDNADSALLVLERDPTDKAGIAAVFRSFHTIKGMCGFLGLADMQRLSHETENLLDDIRGGKRLFKGPVVDATFHALDFLKTMVADLNATVVSGQTYTASEADRHAIAMLVEEITESRRPSSDVPPETPEMPNMEEPGEEETRGKGMASRTAVGASSGNIRVNAAKIDLMLEAIGELVIAESIVEQDPEIRALASSRLEKNITHLGKITRYLQDISMAMRLISIDATFSKMERMVRDICRQTGKSVHLEISGGETELDRSIVERLNEPLVHVLRNAVDHGIGSRAERMSMNKDPVGKIQMKAFYRGGNIHVEVSDDGKGLDKAAILAKALERGLVSEEEASSLSDDEIYDFVFEPGFSTARTVTRLSGRGVGMDVVRTGIEALRGTVVIRSVPGQGATISMVLPLTTAIIDGMRVRVGTESYVIPIFSIVQSFRPVASDIHKVADQGEVVRFRKRLLPFFRLDRLFGIQGAIVDPMQAIVMVVEESGKTVALLVDELLGQQQTVIKSLGAGLGNLPGIAGACILTDGQPGLVVDIAGIVKLAVLRDVRLPAEPAVKTNEQKENTAPTAG